MLKRRKWRTIANNFHSKTVLSRESINSVSAASFRRRKKLMNNIHISFDTRNSTVPTDCDIYIDIACISGKLAESGKNTPQQKDDDTKFCIADHT
jgi:hypothetical protein